MNYPNLKKGHSRIYRLIEQELKRQKRVINLVPSENFVSQAVLEALATPFTNKYAEGYPHRRYYHGNEVSDKLEDYTKGLALKIFKLSPEKWSVNVQPYSGSPANIAVYTALVGRGEKILSMNLEHGGHLTHGHKVSVTGQTWNFAHYGVGKDGFIDYAEVETIAQKEKPKLIICGATAYSRQIDFAKFGKIAKKINALLLADISHVAGLVVGGAHPSPFSHADVVTSTTHKTLRGPRGAFIVSRAELSDKIDKAVFPGLQGGPHLNNIAAMAVAFEEALKPNFKKYARQIIKNTQALAAELKKYGFKVISGGTDNHLLLVDVTPLGLPGKEAGELLEKAGIIVNKNIIPYDTRKPWDPSGIRLGTPAVTTRGMKEKEMRQIAECIRMILIDRLNPLKIRKEVERLTHRFKIPLTPNDYFY